MRFSRRLRLATAIILSFASAAVFPQQQRTVVRLKSRDIIIHKEGVSRSFIAELRRTDLPRLHAFVQLRQPADRELAQALRAENLALLFPLTSDVWVAAVEKKFDESDAAVLKFVRWLDEIRPDDKIAPEIDKKRFFDWAVEQDGRLRLMVQFFEDVSDKNAEAILETYTSDFEGMAIQHTWAIRARRDVVKGLSRHDEVKWIDQGPAPFRPLLNFTRRAIHADEVQEFDAAAATYRGVTGLGTQVGVWDEGIDPRHDDFLGRILVPGLAGRHGTAVAGVIGASGVGSAACVASPYLYRGVAPKTELISRTPWRGVSPAIFDIARSIFDNGMDASNHSYVQATNGHYLFIAEQMDRIVRGDERDGVRPIPPRPMVWAAGNNGLFPEYSDVEGYFSVEAPAKNPIVVGGTTAGSLNHLADFSALGPTWDG
ncbi:MAG: S8 family serine peptidase, partial [Thermoanaerobaculia bacterium]